MLVKNWMSDKVITIDVNDSMQNAIKLLREQERDLCMRYPVKKILWGY
jgi:hypothetical protein